MNEERIKALMAKAKDKRYNEYVEEYGYLSESEKFDRRAMYAYADALYELGRDIESLKAYLNFVDRHPNEKATNFALFGAAVSLKNLDLQKEALEVFNQINPAHEGLNDEVDDCNKKIKLQFQAKAILRRYFQG